MESKRASRLPPLRLCSRKQRKFAIITPTSKVMPPYQTITSETIPVKSGTIALITLNRPEKRNAISAAMIAEVMSALDDLESGQRTRGDYHGAGKAFCAGMDLDALKARRRNPRSKTWLTREGLPHCFAGSGAFPSL